jgi:hypothetical protein
MLAWAIQKHNAAKEDLMLFENLNMVCGARRDAAVATTNGSASTFAESV